MREWIAPTVTVCDCKIRKYLLRCFGPQRAGDLSLRASVERTSAPNTTVFEATLGTSGSGPTDVPLMLMPMTPR